MTKNSIPRLPARTCGVYTITCTANGRKYVGASVDIAKRFARHFWSLENGTHGNTHLSRAWGKHGAAAFSFEVIELVSDPSSLIMREQYWIDKLNTAKRGFNICPQAGTTAGVKLNPLTVKKSAESRRGKPRSEETKRRIADALRGREVPDDQIEKMRRAKQGKTLTDEHKAKISAALTGRKRGPFSEEHRQKLSVAHLGQGLREETKRKLSDALKGKHSGENNPYAKLTAGEVAVIKRRLINGEGVSAISRDYYVSSGAIYEIKLGRNWGHVPPSTE